MKYFIEGKRPLRGDVKVSGSKNATLPIMAATLLSAEEFTLSNVPDISDVHKMLEIMKHVGSEFHFENNVLRIQTETIKSHDIPFELVKSMRASLLLVGPLLSRCGSVGIGFPGGCVLGKRPVDTHLDAFRDLGVTVKEKDNFFDFNGTKAVSGMTVLKEISVTGTENMVMFASSLNDVSTIRLAAAEPHVQDLCNFLQAGGIPIGGIGTHTLSVQGGQMKGISYEIRSDYLEVGTLAIAAAATQGNIRIFGGHRHDLDALWQKMSEAGIFLDFSNGHIEVVGRTPIKPIAKVDTGIFPKFPTDLQAPFMVLMTEAEGVSKVFETLFEGRLSYLYELEKMGAKFEFMNSHQAIIWGPCRLRAARIESCDIRAGAAMIVAGLAAEGVTEVLNVNYIQRGYEKLDEKLRSLGAHIVLVDDAADLEHRSLKSYLEEAAGVVQSPGVSGQGVVNQPSLGMTG
jgi:UDP-N-acetylglucosamine 1-carboxyvinyltransferase